MNWRDITYLSSGNARQRKLFGVLQTLRLRERLLEFDPTCVSTICVGLDLPESDVDVICEVQRWLAFPTRVREELGSSYEMTFQEREEGAGRSAAHLIHFSAGGFEFEIFGVQDPVEQQAAWRHLTLMKRVVDAGGQEVRERILSLRREGLKAEAAICSLLNLNGNPYVALLELEKVSEGELTAMLGAVR